MSYMEIARCAFYLIEAGLLLALAYYVWRLTR